VASDLITGPLRRNFQLDFGDSGIGFVSLASPLYQTPAVTRSVTNGWTTTGLRRSSIGQLCACGLAGLGLTANQPGERAWLTAHCLTFDIYLLAQPGGGAVDIMVDGDSYETDVSLDSDKLQATYLPVDCTDDSLHSLEIRVASAGWVTVLGIVTERDGPGVVYDSLGVNGARATNLLAWDPRVLESNLERRGPDLIIIAYGSNEVTETDLDLRKYRTEFLDVLLRFRRAAPRASLLVVSPPDRAVLARGRWVTAPAMRGLVAAQRLAAFEAGAAFWNLFEAMGGEGSIERWATSPDRFAQPDRVHLTRAGYRAVADALYNQLRREYGASQNGGPVR
ncbi:MAG TPA: GDSL-type esterase/lipase family protein, partial [Blastocatellia bacterium]|nr:GDSL-type esterase/lipase family protein [Blastocatellia bacterium]